ncbi:GNAT family N-acetyltransferase [Paenibacillus sp. PK3_47]|uniref:GNAT family N-acetyltransferase n=1 Tax=Paenibacillus sp. PK3_47 TaxID=2072642 RepID=UPI00201E4E8F|nr:GNAT family N-acetyltransferase [Paenibacillus sp. PK3_47]UQZ32483.1 GNAT family N-acetyltransferase [Paenibacillus sp. PK3_47]
MLPVLETDRLLLRAFELTDASSVQELAGDVEVARTTLSIPHPYSLEDAESWISFITGSSNEGQGYPFALVSKDSNLLIGCMSINVARPHQRGELAYWIGQPYWGKDYATEAARRLVRYGFEELDLNKIWAAAMSKNMASWSVMKKAGMYFEGEQKQHILKWDQFEDVVYYGMTKTHYTGGN